MINILILNPLNKTQISINELQFENTKDKENFNFIYKSPETPALSNCIDEHFDIIVTEYSDDDALNNFYFELQIFSKSYLIPLIYIIDESNIDRFPISFIDESSDFIYRPIDKIELRNRLKLLILKNSQLKNNIQIDRTTNLPNYKSFYRKYHEETIKCLRYKRKLSIAMINVVNLNLLKSEIGNYHCDNIMRELSDIIKKTLRDVDYCARFAFDKFIAILPETEEYNSKLAIDRLIKQFENYFYVTNDPKLVKPINIKIKAAVAGFPGLTNDSIELIKILNENIGYSDDDKNFEVKLVTLNDEFAKTILIIEDEHEIFTYIKELLQDYNYKILWYTKYSEDIEKVLIEKKVSLMIVDIMLPNSDRDGYEIIESIRKKAVFKDLPILVITAKGGPLKIIEVGADDYLLKPFKSKELLDKIEFHFNKTSPLNKLLKLDDNRVIDYDKYFGVIEKSIDTITQLPTIGSIMNELRDLFKNAFNFGVIYINIAKYNELEINYGEKIFDSLLSKTAALLKNMRGTLIRSNDMISITRLWDDDFVIFLSPPRRQEKIKLSDLNDIKNRIEKFLRENKTNIISRGLEFQFDFYLGYSILDMNREIKFERLIYNNLKHAMMMAYDKESQVSVALQTEFKEIIVEEKINILYQPIIDLTNGNVCGYEALARGPQKSLLFNPMILFSTAYQLNKIWELERIIRKKTIADYMKFNLQDKYLSMNIEPKTFSDPEFRKFAEMNPHNLNFANFVLEITERTNIVDLHKFNEQLDLFKRCKFTIAIDDAGSGYASLYYIAEIKPDLVKLDISLIKNIHTNPQRRDIVKALVSFAEQHSIKVLAEGVETIDEFNEIKKIGVRYAQGFYFGKPSKELIEKVNI